MTSAETPNRGANVRRLVEFAFCDHFSKLRVPSHEAGGFRSTIRGVFAHAEFVDAIGVEGRASAGAMNAAGFDFAEVCE